MRVPLEADKVSLPALGRVPTKLLANLPKEVAERYSCWENIRNPLPLLEEGPVHLGVGGSRSEYLRFLQRLLERDMTALQEHAPTVVNPVFFVKKLG